MSTIFTKLIKDFRYAGGKLILLILAAGLAAWGVSAVTYSYFLSERDFEENFARTFPADLEVVVDNYQEGLGSRLQSMATVSTVERREVLGGRIKSAGGSWMPLVVYGVADLQHMELDVFRVVDQKEGDHPQLLIETNARYFLDPTWDSIQVQIPGHQEFKWAIGGTSHDARLAPARMERAVFAHATKLELLEPYLKEGRRRFLIEANVPKNMSELQTVGQQLRSVIEAAGSQVVLLNIPKPGAHMHQNIVDGVAFLQRGSGVILAFMGITLLSLILLTWIFPQVRDIGVMKAMGAATGNIFYGYLLALLTVILIGLAMGIPVGYYTATRYNQFIAFIQNFEPVETLLPLKVHALVLMLSLLLPLAFAVLPITRAARTTVQEAVTKTFFAPRLRLFRWLQPFVTETTRRYNLNNLFRSGPRTILLILLIALGLGLFFTGVNLKYSVKMELSAFAESAKYAIRVRLGQEMTKEKVAFLNELPFVKSISPLKDRTAIYRPPELPYTLTRNVRFLSAGHTIDPEMLLKGEIDPNCRDCVYLGSEAVRQEYEHLPLGTPIDLTFDSGEVQTFRYAGVFKDMAAVGSPFFIFDDAALSTFNALAFAVDPSFSYSKIQNGIDDALLENGIDMQGLLSVPLRMAQLQGHLEPTYLIIQTTGLLTILLGCLGLLIVLRLSIQERTREIGIIKSIGGTVNLISSLFRREFLLINILALIFGVLVSIPLTATMCQVLSETVIYHQIPTQVEFLTTGITALILLSIQAVLISFYNRLKIKKNARELMDHHF